MTIKLDWGATDDCAYVDIGSDVCQHSFIRVWADHTCNIAVHHEELSTEEFGGVLSNDCRGGERLRRIKNKNLYHFL